MNRQSSKTYTESGSVQVRERAPSGLCFLRTNQRLSVRQIPLQHQIPVDPADGNNLAVFLD